MLEIRKGTFSKNYENSFFREFAKHLSKSFNDKGWSGLLIGSPLCSVDERLQIDALLITKSVACIIDFKNYSGVINLPYKDNFELGIWTNSEGEQIKGGSAVNPFIQLKNQKRRLIDVFNRYIKEEIVAGDTFNPTHVVRVVCFHEEVEIKGVIPPNEALNFFILHKSNFIEGISDIVDVSEKDVSLSDKSFDAFKRVFRADQFQIETISGEDKIKDIAEKSAKLNYGALRPDQKAALIEIRSFLENDDQQIFILQGTVNSGKSYLIPFIKDLAYNVGIQETEVFAASLRVANNLVTSGGIDRIHSLYSYIYGGQKTESRKRKGENSVVVNEEAEEEQEPLADDIVVEEVPIKNCDNADNALFIVDESQLVSDSFHQSIDIVFGSGYLLKDFIAFSALDSSKRKIVFIGDPYLLQLGRSTESPLNPAYLEETYKLKTNAFQLVDKPEISEINRQAIICVDQIRAKCFHYLRFKANDKFRFLQKEEVDAAIRNLIDSQTGHILCYSNEEAQKVNCWIKESFMNNGTDLSPGDLVLFNNNIETEDEKDPFAEPKRIFNGQFATVVDAKGSFEEAIANNKKEETVLTFRELTLLINESNLKVKVLSLENFRKNAKAEISKNETIALKILLNSCVNAQYDFVNSKQYQILQTDVNFIALSSRNEEYVTNVIKHGRLKANTEEKKELKQLINRAKKEYRNILEYQLRKDPSSEYYRYRNVALLRFGWALTVHKAMSYKWVNVIFNVETGEGSGHTNENHFKWLYTGISRAKETVSLVNYKPISPFDEIEFVDNNSTGKRSLDVLFISANIDSSRRLAEFKEFIECKLLSTEIRIIKLEHLNWQERYTFVSKEQKVIISFGYNGEGRFRMPSIISGEPKLGNTLTTLIKNKSTIPDFSIIKDDWRKNQYERLAEQIKHYDIYCSQIIQTKFKDKIKYHRDEDELDVEIDYKGDGSFSKITAKYYSQNSIWEALKDSINRIRES